MEVIISARPVKGRKMRQLQRLTRMKLTGKRQDSMDDQDMKVGPNRGNEAFFDK